MASKQELLDYLDKHVFLRILHATEHDLGTKQREDLEDLKKRTQDEMGRFHGYDSAEKVVQMFRENLNATHEVPVNARLQDQHLPRFADVADAFMQLAGENS